METQLNFRSTHLYAIILTKKAGYNEIPGHLGTVILLILVLSVTLMKITGKYL